MFTNKTILIIDDKQENIDSLKQIIHPFHQIISEPDGSSAIKAFKVNNPDLIILSLDIPFENGFEILSDLKKMSGKFLTPVILVSSFDDREIEAKGLLLGASDFILTPFNTDLVRIKIDNQIEHKMYRDHLESLVAHRTVELTTSCEALVMGMSLLAEGRYNSTGKHIRRMQRYTEVLATRYHQKYPKELSSSDVEQIVLLCPLHDVGKACVSDLILLKKGALKDDEFEEVKKHSSLGSLIFNKTEEYIENNTRALKYAMEIAGYHHEKFDGSGYPDGLVGEDIPLSARIVSVSDTYDALTRQREYKNACTHQEAVKIILEGDDRTKPQHFDPKILEVFYEVNEIIEMLSENFKVSEDTDSKEKK